jgi:hypothetical protein
VLEEPANHAKTETPNATNVAFEPKTYRHFLDDSEWTDAEKDEFVTALWGVVLGFVDLGFDRDPVQQAISVRSGDVALVEGGPAMLSFHDTFNKQSNTETARSETSAARKKES